MWYNEFWKIIIGGKLMPYELLEKQIKSLPEALQLEVVHYVGYLFSLYNKKPSLDSITECANAFLQENPGAFDEFSQLRECGLEAIRELTKNDTW